MTKIVVEIPEDLKELAEIKEIDFSLLVSRIVKERLEKIARLSKELEKSKLSEKKAKEIADKINEDLAKKYIKMYGKK